MSTALAKGIGGVGWMVSVGHLVESTSDLVSDSPRSETPGGTFSYRKVDGGLGLLSSGFSIFQSVAVMSGRYSAARSLSIFAIAISATQFLLGGVAFSNKEPGYSGTDLLLPGLQMVFLVSGLSYSCFSLPALALRAKGGDDQALNRLYMRWYDKKDPKAAREISRLAVDNPYRFSANHSTVLFSEAVDDASVRYVLDDLLKVQYGISLPSASGMVLQATLDRPALFQHSDIKELLVHLRALQGREISGSGSLGLEQLVLHRPALAERVIEEAPTVFKGDDWVLFQDSLRSVWYKIKPDRRAAIARSWAGKLMLGQENGMRPTRDLFRLLEKDRYEEFVERRVREGIATLAADRRLPAEYGRLTTPVLEDVMIACSHSGETTDLMEKVGMMVLARKDLDIGAFDFLFCDNACWKGTPLRKEALAWLSRIASDPEWKGADGEAMLSLVVHGERRIFGRPGLFNGWFLNHDWQREYFHYVEELIMRDGEHVRSPVLSAIGRLHGWRFDQAAETVVKWG